MVTRKHEKPRGILGVRPDEPMGYARYWPSPDLAPFVEHYWIVEWDLPEPQSARVLSHPSVHLALEAGKSCVHGVVTHAFTRVMEGTGRVLGTKFRPGGFRPFFDDQISALTDRVLPLDAVFGDAGDLEARVVARRDHDGAISVVEEFLRSRNPLPDGAITELGAIIERIAADRQITKVEQIVALHHINLRKLQRLFRAYVGVSPKWVIQRYRLHEAAERAAAGGAIDWADLALDLGYADQAHFIRDFKRLVGRSPAEYGRSLIVGR